MENMHETEERRAEIDQVQNARVVPIDVSRQKWRPLSLRRLSTQ